MKRKWTSDVGQWWNIVEIYHAKRNSKMIWYWWRENEHRTLVNDEILLKFIIFREILKWSDFDEENKNIGRWSMMEYCSNSSWWEKFKTDLILKKRKTTSDVGQWWNIVEIHHLQRNSKMIWFWWREKEYWTLVNVEILLKFIMMGEILKWSHSEKEKNKIGRWSMMKYCWNSSSSEKF